MFNIKRKNFYKKDYFKWVLCIILILIIPGIILTHVNHTYASTSDKNLNSFLSISKVSLINLKNILYNQITATQIDINKIDIPIFKLFVRQNKIDKLNSQLPKIDYFGITHISKDYVAGNIVFNETIYPSRVRYRGDNYFHWRFPKKSWRVKLSDKKIINGSNKINLINPKFDSHMNTQLSYYMAEKMNLLFPRSYYAVLFLNNIYNGVYYYTDQIDETFLRMKNKLPGNIYFGEIEDDFNFLFDNTNYWEIVAATDGDEGKAKEKLNFFLNSINNEDLNEFYKFFNRHVGKDYIKFDALIALMGSYQPDQFHNQKFYFNPSNAKFENIVWDLMPFLDEYLNLSLNYFNNPLVLKMHLIPKFVNERNKIIYEYMNGELSEENLIKIIEDWENKIEYEMKHDKFKDAEDRPNTLTMKGWKKAVEKLKENIKVRYKFLRDSLNQVDVTMYVIDKKIILDVNGESAVRLEDNNLREILYPGRSVGKIDWTNIFENKLNYAPLRYKFNLENIKLFNSITGEEIIPKMIHLNDINELPELEKVDSMPSNKNRTIVFDRNKILTEDLIINKEDTLIIKSGVTIKLEKDVSIISYGQIIAEGTSNNPIIFTKNSNEPWGSIIMQGIEKENSKQNHFKHCYISGGSGEEYEHVLYTGQVSVYNSEAYFENCKFFNNEIEDDNFNSKNSYIEIKDCEFENSLFDAIDFDISEGKIIDTKITTSGNDGIDLMTSNILVENNIITNSEDKGISIGEKSNPKIINNLISDSNIAVAIKDMSNPVIANNVIESNNIAFAAYHKNWHYEYGGRGKIYKNVLNLNKKDYSIDEFSTEIDTDSGKFKFNDSHMEIINNGILK